jgi:alkanesulfonate monooxygenase SsuD/methylene tetrahydromethanopterin reductase-like flavin-dependent oxidoreductase (luciferase family)
VIRLSTVILPIYRWEQGQEVWRRAEELGFHAGYTYDHLSWQSFRDRPWYGAIPTLTAAALATERLRIGTLVTSPNFRHPVTLAKDLMTLDDISDGRLTVGIGSGGTGFDATALGQPPWTAGERADRLDEFLPLLDRLLIKDATTERGRFYSAEEVRMIPGCVQRPRVPFIVAATGRRGLDLAARLGEGWVTYGDPAAPAGVPPEQVHRAVASQLSRLDAACRRHGRDVGSIDRMLLQGMTAERPLASVDAFVDWAGTYQALGCTDLVIHWPVTDSVFDHDPGVFEQIATEGMAQLVDSEGPGRSQQGG